MKIAYISFAIFGLVLLGAGCQGTGTALAPPAASDVGAPVSPSSVKLDLSGRGLEKVPADVFDRIDLEELNVSNNRLTGALPSQIQRLRNLRVLDASRNEMTGVPAEIGQLSALEDLNLSDNKLTGLPLELGNLRHLRRLNLGGNAVSKQDLDQIRSKLTGTQILE